MRDDRVSQQRSVLAVYTHRDVLTSTIHPCGTTIVTQSAHKCPLSFDASIAGGRERFSHLNTHSSRADIAVDPDVFTSPQQTSAELPTLPYFVHRTLGQQLPVYHERRRGGNLLETRVQKITGRVEALKKDLQRELDIPNDKIIISPVNRHIVIKVCPPTINCHSQVVSHSAGLVEERSRRVPGEATVLTGFDARK